MKRRSFHVCVMVQGPEGSGQGRCAVAKRMLLAPSHVVVESDSMNILRVQKKKGGREAALDVLFCSYLSEPLS